MNTTSQNQQRVVGPHAVEEALKGGKPLNKAYIQQTEKQRLKELSRALKAKHVPVNFVPREKLDRMSKAAHQGIIALSSPIEFRQLSEWLVPLKERQTHPVLVLLDGITDVRNLGAIARSALSLGCAGLVIQQTSSAAINEEAIKASAGSLLHLPVYREPNLVDAAFMLQAEGFELAACTEHAQTSWEMVEVEQPLAIVLGAEGSGIQSRLLRAARFAGRIPMTGHVGSLNVSVAAGIALFLIRQKRQHNYHNRS